MLHTVDKGLFFSLLDERYSGSVAEKEKILAAMRAGGANVFRDQGTLNGTGTAKAGNAMGGTSAADINKRMKHLYEHWFGYVRPGTQTAGGLDDWDDPYNPNAPGGNYPVTTTTGWWSRWNGDAFNIFRMTLVRAIEVSLGLDVDQPPPGTRDWPIDFLWICGAPKFEGWISWSAHGTSGRVHVLLVTPSIAEDPHGQYTSGISLSLTQGVGPVHGTADYEEIDGPNRKRPRPTPTSAQMNGLWVVGHQFSQVEVDPGVFPSLVTPDGDWLIEEDERWGTVSGRPHPIKTVQPAEEDGGMLMLGRSWP